MSILALLGMCAVVSVLFGLITHSVIFGLCVFVGCIAWTIFDTFFGKGNGT